MSVASEAGSFTSTTVWALDRSGNAVASLAKRASGRSLLKRYFVNVADQPRGVCPDPINTEPANTT